MAELIVNEVAKYLDDLNATHEVNNLLGTTLSLGNNLFVVYEPQKTATCVTIIPYGGYAPDIDNYKRDSNFQIRLKGRNIHSSLKAAQALIDLLHTNENVCASTPGKVFAIQSSPIPLGWEEGGEYIIVVGNYRVKYIKL